MSKVVDACSQLGLDDSLPTIVATEYARLLAYKDEYEVARLYSLPAFTEQLKKTFTGDFKFSLHLAPPILSRSGPDGRPKKRQFGSSILSLFKLLQHGKKIRGTWIDPFSHTQERRTERAWIEKFESDVSLVLTELNVRNVEQAKTCLLYTSPSPRDKRQSRMPSSA